MNYFDANVSLKGQTPILIHRAAPIVMNRTRKKTDTFEDEWKTTVYLSSAGDGLLVMPALNVEACVRNAAKGHKIGRQAARSFVAAAVQITSDEIPFTVDGSTITIEDVENNGWLFTTTAVVNRARINRTRVSLPPGWSLDFDLMCTSDIIKPDFLQELLEEAGARCGLGDWRPGAPTPGRFGKFELEQYEVH
jgi:hypothetical protein